ncbi:MAG: hypothetical protein Kow0025_00090 [Thermodesulfovibrionales bacterium]
MKALAAIAVSIAVSLLLMVSAARADDLEVFVRSLNVEAEADMGGFRAGLSAQFGVPGARVDLLLRDVDSPADAYMCLRIGQIAHLDMDLVLREYRANKGKGWGVIAKNLGIKPGSREFHALKEGRPFKGNGKGNGKDKKHKG